MEKSAQHFLKIEIFENATKYSIDERDYGSIYHFEYDSKYKMTFDPNGSFSFELHAFHTTPCPETVTEFKKCITGTYSILKNDDFELFISLAFLEVVDLKEKDSQPSQVDDIVYYIEQKWFDKKGFVKPDGSYIDYLSAFNIVQAKTLFAEEITILEELGMNDLEENIRNLEKHFKPEGKIEESLRNFLHAKYPNYDLDQKFKWLKKRSRISEFGYKEYKQVYKNLIKSDSDPVKAFELWKPEYAKIKAFLEENHIEKPIQEAFTYFNKGYSVEKVKNILFPNYLRDKYKEEIQELVSYYGVKDDENIASSLEDCGGDLKVFLTRKYDDLKIIFKREIENLIKDGSLYEKDVKAIIELLPKGEYYLPKVTESYLKTLCSLIKNEKEYFDFKVLLRKFDSEPPITPENYALYLNLNKDPYLTGIKLVQNKNETKQGVVEFLKNYEKYQKTNTNAEICGAMNSFYFNGCNDLEHFKEEFFKEIGKSLTDEIAIRMLSELMYCSDRKNEMNEVFFGEKRKELYKLNEIFEKKYPYCNYQNFNIADLYPQRNIYYLALRGYDKTELIFTNDVEQIHKEFPELDKDKILAICVKYLNFNLTDLGDIQEIIRDEVKTLREIQLSDPELLKKIEAFDSYFNSINFRPNSKFYDFYMKNNNDFFVTILKMKYPNCYEVYEKLQIPKNYLLSAFENLKIVEDNSSFVKEKINQFKKNHNIYMKKEKELSSEEILKIFAVIGEYLIRYSTDENYSQNEFERINDVLLKKDEFLKKLKTGFIHLIKGFNVDEYDLIILSENLYSLTFYPFHQVLHRNLGLSFKDIFRSEIEELKKAFPTINEKDFLVFLENQISTYDDSQKDNLFLYFKTISDSNKKNIVSKFSRKLQDNIKDFSKFHEILEKNNWDYELGGLEHFYPDIFKVAKEKKLDLKEVFNLAELYDGNIEEILWIYS